MFNVMKSACMPSAFSSAVVLSAKKLKYLKNPSMPRFALIETARNSRRRRSSCDAAMARPAKKSITVDAKSRDRKRQSQNP
jgi:hypothetical protein